MNKGYLKLDPKFLKMIIHLPNESEIIDADVDWQTRSIILTIENCHIPDTLGIGVLPSLQLTTEADYEECAAGHRHARKIRSKLWHGGVVIDMEEH